MYETKTTASDWDKTLITLSKGPSESESQKCENTENAIRKAITSNAKLSQMDISIFAQGSYKARTNVRAESDVDIAVLLNTVAYNDYPVGLTAENFGFTRHFPLNNLLEDRSSFLTDAALSYMEQHK